MGFDGAFADHEPVGAPIKALAISPAQDRSIGRFADGEVDGARCARNDEVMAGLLPLPRMRRVRWPRSTRGSSSFGGASLADPEPVEAERYGERREVAVVLVGGDRNTP